jgi:hypothetical protein
MDNRVVRHDNRREKPSDALEKDTDISHDRVGIDPDGLAAIQE